MRVKLLVRTAVGSWLCTSDVTVDVIRGDLGPGGFNREKVLDCDALIRIRKRPVLS